MKSLQKILAEIVFDFYDDQQPIIDRLEEFYNHYSFLIPKNLTLNLNYYNGNKLTKAQDVEIPKFDLTGITGITVAPEVPSIPQLGLIGIRAAPEVQTQDIIKESTSPYIIQGHGNIDQNYRKSVKEMSVDGTTMEPVNVAKNIIATKQEDGTITFAKPKPKSRILTPLQDLFCSDVAAIAVAPDSVATAATELTTFRVDTVISGSRSSLFSPQRSSTPRADESSPPTAPQAGC